MENTLPNTPIENYMNPESGPIQTTFEEVPKKTSLPWLVVGLLLGILVAGGAATYYMYTQSQENPTTRITQEEPTIKKTNLMANVTYLTGTAYQLVDERRIEILEGDVLGESAIIITGENSRLVLQLDDGSIISLDSDTKISLTDLSSDNIEIREDSGVVFSRVNKDKNHKYSVIAGNVVVESMGTVFSVENTDKVNVKVFESSVKIKNRTKEEETIEKNKEWIEDTSELKDLDSEKIAEDEFLSWNLEKEEIVKEQPNKSANVEKENEPKQNTPQIEIYGERKEDGIFVSWSVLGMDTSEGFKIVKSQDSNPTFPEDGYLYVSDSSVRNYKLALKDGKTWHIRVCRYNGDGSCSYYSNDISVTAPYVEKGEKSENGDVDSIRLEAHKKSDTKVELDWNVEGKSNKGFKVVWSRNSKPTYPTREGDSYHYLSSSSAREDTVKDLKEGKKYYFRVCEYLGGKCGTYSNEVSVEL